MLFPFGLAHTGGRVATAGANGVTPASGATHRGRPAHAADLLAAGTPAHAAASNGATFRRSTPATGPAAPRGASRPRGGGRWHGGGDRVDAPPVRGGPLGGGGGFGGGGGGRRAGPAPVGDDRATRLGGAAAGGRAATIAALAGMGAGVAAAANRGRQTTHR
ncbi:hypothetical protein BU14_0517s0011 [Porphyra umbilicalis]|uniref:Uncharacterized protein n=1 Tax=Porphyra umbilicalis TaxID=2786 RepID=A0A1X6NSP9_PORUM|nr:hypothetical protein BU14_0517s0011 [Porphyra umbilicalis]|eukprot:OSX71641.1 hypothetical protein BU14_0517s0011 [Porphyra umbilicalis]